VPSYTGDVQVGGPADTRELPGLTITKLAVSDMRALIGDARVTAVVTTHGHWDHHRALPDVVASTGAATMAHPADAPDLPVPVSHPVEHGGTVAVGDQVLDVVHLRGHTPGSIALVWRGGDAGTHVFTGDSLFPGGVGNTQKDPERFAQLVDDVEQRLFGTLPDQTWVYPGHGKDTTIGAERPHLAEWRERGW
jgi:glyoxylase-like metal-dependent hydrolase (beta-lactamase superfamily II)